MGSFIFDTLNGDYMEKTVLLFSGGFDSILQEYLIKPDVLLYVDMKTTYSQREIEFLKTLPKSYQDRLVIKELPLGEYERANMYLPYRNLILGTIAMQYGQHVCFGFNYSDCAPDKDDEFLRRLHDLFIHLNKNCLGDMGWDNNNFSFDAPFSDLTKTEMVKKVINRGMPVEFIQNIRSCYSGTSQKGCGECPVCAKKAVALLNNGIYKEELFDKSPMEVIKSELSYMKKYPEDYDKKVIDETKKALGTLSRLRQEKK